MPKYEITATSTKVYEVTVEAEDEVSALAQLDEWIADDFEEFEVSSNWTLEAN